MNSLTFTIAIEPKSVQFGARIGRTKSGRSFMYSNDSKTAYLATVAALAHQYRPAVPLAGPLTVDLVFIMPRPQAMMGKRWPDGLTPCAKRPDMDNLRKGTQDALSAFWLNDSQICDGRTAKFYAEKTGTARIEVSISPIL